MKRPDHRGPKPWLLTALCAAVLAACSSESPERLVESARTLLVQGEHHSAVIQLRSALQLGASKDARVLLGSALLAGGDAQLAELELRKALSLGADEDDVVPALAQALNEMGRSKEVVEQFGSTHLKTPAARAGLDSALAWALSSTGDAAASVAALQRAFASVPGYPAALLFKARMRLADGDVNGALELIDQVLGQSGRDHDAWLLRGDIFARARQDSAEAAKAYAQALAARPDSRGAHTGLVLLAFAAGDWEAAARQIEALKKARTGDWQAIFLEGRLALGRGDLKTAQEKSAQLLKGAPDHLGVLMLAGSVEFQRQSYVQAQVHLHKALSAAPDLRQARILLGQSYARSGQPARALDILHPLARPDSQDAEALAIAGEAYLQTGQAAKAEDAFVRATRISPDDVRSRTALALMKISRGDTGDAFDQLESIARSSKGAAADLTLVSALLRRGEFKDALKAIDQLETKEPKSPLPHYLRGASLLGLKRHDVARQSFEQALRLNPNHFPSIERLAALDVAEGKQAVAQQRFEDLVKAVPGHVEATAVLATLRLRAGVGSESIVALVSDSIRSHPTAVKPRLLLVDHYLARQRNDLALSAAQEALAAVPDHPQLIEALGRVQMASGSLNQAVSSFNKLATLEPDSPLAYLRMADAQAAMKQFDAARQSLRKAMAVVPSSPDVVQRMVTLELMAGQLNRAQVLAREVSQSQPETGLGQALEGDVAASAQRWEAAATAYRASMKARPSTAVAMKLHATLVRAKRDTDSKALAAKWLDEHPKDLVFLGYLGDSALAAKAFEDAEKKYERLLTLSPNDVRALNNIAWIKMQAQSADALTFARKAHQLQPDSAAILDTLGLALLAQDLAADAQAVLEKAVALEPGNLSIKLSLAKAYLRLGRREQAKYLLDVLKNAGEKFPLQDEVAKLLAAV